jgi:hypothetical protein
MWHTAIEGVVGMWHTAVVVAQTDNGISTGSCSLASSPSWPG